MPLPPLVPGDTVAILSPASAVKDEYIDGAVQAIAARGYRPLVMPHARGNRGSYSAAASDRVADMRQALADPDVKAIICSRGGYGCVDLLEAITPQEIAANSKWLAGFSDVSALHALWQAAGLPPVHASMARALTEGAADDHNNDRLWHILEGGDPSLWFDRTAPYPLPADQQRPQLPDNRPGRVRGRVVGGNMAVIMGLYGTPLFPAASGDILLIEDVGEEIYRVERMLHQLRLGGLLPRLGALLVGRFTAFRAPTADWPSMEAMIAQMVAPYSFPVAYDVPVGHIGNANTPILLGAEASLEISLIGLTLSY